jgi:TonB-linked SusC/RagA family outer membrane protein
MANRRSTLRLVAAGALLSSLLAGSLLAQGGTVVITGRVLNDKGLVLEGASVTMPQFGKTASVNSQGRYRIEVPANNQLGTLVARALGRSPVAKDVNLVAGAHTVDFELSSTVRLNEVVVTGVAQATEQSKLTIGVAKVSGEALTQVVGSSPLSALAGKVAGARVALPRGVPGGNPVIKLRGSTNLGLGGSTPLLVVDGVITQGSLQDLDASDIESIEVLKGAASANTYGSAAANGVLAITTKRGKGNANNKVSFSTRTEMGSGSVERFVPLNKHNPYALNADGSFQLTSSGLRILKADGIADSPYPAGTWRNQQQEWMANGGYQNTSLNMAMRRGTSNLSTTYSFEHNQGILPFLKGEQRQNFRLNADQAITDKIDLSISATYGLNTNDQSTGDQGGFNTFFALMQAPPDLDLRHPFGAADSVQYNPYLPPAFSPNARGNPLYDLSVRQQQFRRERLLGSGVVRYRPFTWLSFDATYGTDHLNTSTQNYLPRGTFSSSAANILLPGTYAVNANRSNNANTTVNTNIQKQWGNLRSGSRITYLKETNNAFNTASNTTKLNIDLPTINGGDPASTAASSSQQEIISENWYGTQQLDWKGKYLMQGMIRRDGSSLFGANQRYHNFYGLSAAYILTEDFKIPGFQELKLRGAQGTAGLRPSFNNQFQTYSLSGGTVSKSQAGNPDLKPAIQTEKEAAISAQFLDRFNAEVTLSNRVTVGAFLAVPLSSAKAGGFTSQVQNAATISAHTFEGSLGYRVIDQSKLQYNVTFTADKTTQSVDRLNRPAYNQAEQFGQSQGNQFWVRQGEALGIMYGDRWVRNPQELLDNPVNKANPAFSLDNYTTNVLGYVVLKSAKGTPSELPIKYVAPDGTTLVKIGDGSPKFAWSMIHDVTWRDVSVHLLVDGIVGGQIYDFTKQWMFQDLRHADEDGTRFTGADRIALSFFSAGMYNGNNSNSYFVEGGTYAKLRELSVNYTLPGSLLEASHLNTIASQVKLALIGRNLKTWTKYSGADPETLGGDDFNYRIDGFRYPSLRQFSAQITITY